MKYERRHRSRVRRGSPKRKWPEFPAAEPMDPEQFEAILFALGIAYGHDYHQMPLSVIAPALGVTPSTLTSWRKKGVPPTAAKLLREFHRQGRIF